MRILASLVLVVACSSKTSQPPEQSFHEGVQALCDLPSHVPAPTTDSYEKRLAVLADWAEHNVTNAEARQVGSIKSIGANKDALAAAVTKAGIQHCLLLDNGMELQSFADAMKTFCEADARNPGYFKSHMLNAEVIRLVEALGDASPADRQQRMHDAVARAGLTSCSILARFSAIGGMKVPTVPDVGLVELESSAMTVITPQGIVVDGKAVISVTNGDVDPAEKEGGAQGLTIPRLQKFLEALANAAPSKPSALGMTLVIDPATPYRLFAEVLFSSKAAGYRTFTIAVHAGAAMKAIPLELPDKRPTPGTPHGLEMVVSITKDKLLLWSISGTEGSLKKPAVDVAPGHIADVQKALGAIVDKHFHDGKRTPDDREIIVMADGATPMQAVAEVVAGVRAMPDGKELFTNVLLSSGFE